MTANASRWNPNTSSTFQTRSRCLVNHPHLLFIHPATMHLDFRDSRVDLTKIAKHRDEDRYSRSSASQTLPVYGRSSEQTASVSPLAQLVGLTGAYPYDGREAVHSTAVTKSALDFNWSRRPSPFLVDDGQL